MPDTKTNRDAPSKARPSGQGRVKDPKKDGRLRENRERGIKKSAR